MVASTCLQPNTMITNLEESVRQAVTSLVSLDHANQSKKKDLIGDDDQKIFISLGVKKIPLAKLGYTKITIIPIPHPIYNEKSSVCLFVKDDSKAADADIDEKTVIHYKQILESNNLSHLINEIIPFHQLRTEFKPFEAKRKLCNSHDLFLTDERVAGYITNLIGKEFWKTKKIPVQVKLTAQNLEAEIKGALSKAYYYNKGTGSLSTLHVANTSQSQEVIVENVVAAVNHLMKVTEGGVDNVRSVHLKFASSISVPLYFDTSSGNDVELPEKAKKQGKAPLEELSTRLHSKVKVYPDGRVKRLKKMDEDLEDSTEDEEEEFIELISKKKHRRRTAAPKKIVSRSQKRRLQVKKKHAQLKFHVSKEI